MRLSSHHGPMRNDLVRLHPDAPDCARQKELALHLPSGRCHGLIIMGSGSTGALWHSSRAEWVVREGLKEIEDHGWQAERYSVDRRGSSDAAISRLGALPAAATSIRRQRGSVSCGVQAVATCSDNTDKPTATAVT
jgi:hypothetical protein